MLGPAHFMVVGLTVLTVMLAVVLHYEVFVRLSGWLEHAGKRGRPRILTMVLSLIVVHVIEIWLFATTGWWLAEHMTGAGTLVAPYSVSFLDYVYLSAVTFTTLGYGEIYPDGAIRFLYGTEALTGFALITWSASLTFLEMQRHWAASDS